MSTRSTFTQPPAAAQSHAEYLALIPTVEKHVKFAFRGRPQVDREEAAAEAVARAFGCHILVVNGIRRSSVEPLSPK
jgi:hypothetical protein